MKYYAQELKENTYNLTRMNLVMRGVLPDNIVARNNDTLEADWPWFEDGKPETYEPLFVDAVVSNPPYSQYWDSSGKDADPRFADYLEAYGRGGLRAMEFGALKQLSRLYWYTVEFGLLRQKDTRAIRSYAEEMIKELDIRCTSPAQPVGTLSGGNQQKVCVARALALNPKFLFVSEPTRGIDIGAKQLVLETLVRLNREKGMTIVMVSSELQELRSICDRIAIVAEGKVVDILKVDASDTAFGLAMSGVKSKEGEGA